MASKLDGLVPPDVLAKYRHALRGDKSGYISRLRANTGCSFDTAVDKLFDLSKLGVVRLLMQPNGEVLIDYLLSPEESNQVLVDAEVKRILDRGVTSLERDMDRARGVVGRTFIDSKTRKRATLASGTAIVHPRVRG